MADCSGSRGLRRRIDCGGVQQRVFRRRAERLLADMQAIELHQSSWADAQAIMRRWGKWGHYDGQCNEESCRYEINISDALNFWMAKVPESAWNYLHPVRIVRTFERMGGRQGLLQCSFIVQDGRIVRKAVSFNLSVPTKPGDDYPDNYGYELIANVVSVQRIVTWGALRGSGEFGKTPYYTASRPGGCEICMEARLIYSDLTPPDVVRRLNAIQLDCLAVWKGCTTIEDLLPASEPFHLYDGTIGGRPAPPPSEAKADPSHGCNTY
jgi:hypothetical protein